MVGNTMVKPKMSSLPVLLVKQEVPAYVAVLIFCLLCCLLLYSDSADQQSLLVAKSPYCTMNIEYRICIVLHQ